MIVEFTCPNCGKTLQAAEKYGGRRIQCRACKTVLQVPGLPPVQETEDDPSDDDSETDTTPEPKTDGFPKLRLSEDSSDSTADEQPEKAPAADSSYGIASLYLAAFSFLLFFTPAVLSSMLEIIGASIVFIAGALVATGCFIFCRHGYRLAEKAETLPGAQGYAAAGKMVNKFFLRFYVLAIAFFIIVAIVAMFRVKEATGGGLMDIFKGLKGASGQ
jgi:hypothetical protein